MPPEIMADFSNFQSTDPTGMATAEGDANMGTTDPTGMAVPEGTIYDPTTIGGRPLFPNTPPPGTEVSETDYKEGMQIDRPDIFNEEELNPGFPVLKIPEDLGNSNVGPIGPEKVDMRPFYDQDGALVFSPEQMGMFQANQPGGFGGDNNQFLNRRNELAGNQFLNRRDELAGLAYGGDVNRSVMNGQNGMSASDKIDNRIMKNLEFQNKFNMGGRTMSTYDKLRSIADSIAEG